MTKRTSKVAAQAKKAKQGNANNTKATTNGSMKMTMYTAPTMVQRSQVKERRPGRPSSGKRLAVTRNYSGKVRSMVRRSLDPCDNSNDSGLGFDHHMDPHSISMTDRLNWSDERAQAKRSKLDIKLENDEVNDSYSFPEHTHTYRDSTMLIRTAPSVSLSSLSVSNSQPTTSSRAVPRCVPIINRSGPPSPATLTTQLQASSRYMDISLSIICQPEQQHRARYQTEGSRGAVKDRSGNGFPIVQLNGYNKPATLQVFIGTDLGKVAPHMFYQACRVSGKNSTPCSEKKIDGTIVIELQLDPSKEMVATCDCVGILKERNVDVEHRFPDQLASRSKKKSTRCRMVFRTTISHDDGMQETLQVCSQPIVCTQPPGIPEISKKSLTSCPASGGLELFIIGKNFLKDTMVYFQSEDEINVRWEQSVVPDKEFLQQTHLVCVVPPYLHTSITEPVTVRLYVISSGKTSEPHQFVYTPVNGAMPSVHMEQSQPAPFLSKMLWSTMTKQEQQDVGMMPPPGTSMVPLSQRRSSTNMISSGGGGEVHSPPMHTLKQEMIDENSQNSVLDPSELRQGRYRHISESSLDVNQGDSNMSMINDNSIDMIRHNQIMHSNLNENSNMSLLDENGIDIMRRSTLCENSMSNDGSRCANFAQAGMGVLRPNEMSTIEDLKVIDLRMKMPMATVADLVNTNAPSLATLQSFGVTESTTLPLPAQSAQSIENYLTNIEIKGQNSQVLQSNVGLLSSTSQTPMSHLGGGGGSPPMRPSFLNQQQILANNTAEVSKSEAAAIGEQTNTLAPSQISRTIPNGILSNAMITTEKLDALVNCAVETHISLQKENEVLMTQDVMMTTPLPPIINTPLTPPQLNPIINNSQSSPNISPEVILNSQISPSLMCRTSPAAENLLTQNICHTSSNVDNSLSAQLLTTTSPLLSAASSNQLLSSTLPNQLLSPTHTTPQHQSATSPNQLLSVATAASPNQLLSASSPNQLLVAATSPATPLTLSVTEPEKAIILNAAADLLETQKKLNDLQSLPEASTNNIINEILTTSNNDVLPSLSQLPNAGNNFYTTANSGDSLDTSLISSKQDNKRDYVLNVPLKEIQGQDKKTEDRMIPQSFATMSENDLIDIINPSCFDQESSGRSSGPWNKPQNQRNRNFNTF